jgi:PIN domain nuclease of toxin-antitoxin system
VILLDTCTLLWLVRGDELPDGVRRRIGDLREAVYVSAISAWEIGTKSSRGALELPLPIERWWPLVLDAHALAEVPVDGAIASLSTRLPPLHRDPADRILLATAQHLRATLFTPDPAIRRYPEVETYWA